MSSVKEGPNFDKWRQYGYQFPALRRTCFQITISLGCPYAEYKFSDDTRTFLPTQYINAEHVGKNWKWLQENV